MTLCDPLSIKKNWRDKKNMGKHLLDIVWSIFTGKLVNYEQILWEDYLQYFCKGAQKEGMAELTFLGASLYDL